MSKVKQTDAVHDGASSKLELTSDSFQTLSTCGATGEQLEFDFGAEFQKPEDECTVDTNSTSSCSETPQKLGGTTKTKEGS
jgi:hypothetical protein